MYRHQGGGTCRAHVGRPWPTVHAHASKKHACSPVSCLHQRWASGPSLLSTGSRLPTAPAPANELLALSELLSQFCPRHPSDLAPRSPRPSHLSPALHSCELNSHQAAGRPLTRVSRQAPGLRAARTEPRRRQAPHADAQAPAAPVAPAQRSPQAFLAALRRWVPGRVPSIHQAAGTIGKSGGTGR